MAAKIKLRKCKVCKKAIRQKKGRGRPRLVHERCKGKKTLKKKTKKKKVAKKKKKTKKKVKRRTTTRSTGSKALAGRGKGWRVFHYSGITAKGNVSNKTWAIKRQGNKVWTRHGKTWGVKKLTPKTFATKQQAVAYYEKKVDEKRAKGYTMVYKTRRRQKRRKRRHRRRIKR
jgi:predicted DNA-binding WGR domain protein